MICEQCITVLHTPAVVSSNGWYSVWDCETTLAAMSFTAATCISCRMTKRALMLDENKIDVKIQIKFILNKSIHDEELFAFTINAVAAGSDRKILFMLVENVARKYKALANLEGSSTGSVQTLTFIKERLKICQETHKTCQELATEQKWYPTRLIEVEDGGARLIDTVDAEPTGPYASLSHSWGGVDILRCTSENIEDLRSGIPTSALSATFRDALHTIRSLCIKYIWIDSLCIIQDSVEDWTREAKSMMKVYQFATVNLAATKSSRSNEGLFTERDPTTLVSETFHIDNGVLKGDFRAVKAAMDMSHWDLDIEGAPLNSRGWVLQERLLSSRVVHFASEQVFWDCSELTASEILPTGAIAADLKSTLTDRKKNSTILKASAGPLEIVGKWATIVNAYSKCHLTFKSDKFIALSGVAEYVQYLLNDQYLCGLWRHRIEEQLCWFSTPSPGETSSRNDLAPSWSWASIDGPIQTPQLQLHEGYVINLFATVINVSSTRREDDGKGQSYSGQLEIRCFLNPVRIEGSYSEPRLTGPGMEHFLRANMDTPDFTDMEELYLVLIFDVQDPVLAKSNFRFAEGRAIILRLVDPANGVYSRCGFSLISAPSNRNTGEFPDSWLKLVSARDKGHMSCKEFDDKMGHLITIV